MSKTTTWYRVKNYEITIGEFAVERFTDASIWWLDHQGRPQQSKRVSSYDRFFPTRDEAVTYLRERATKEVQDARRRLADAEKDLAAIA